MGMRSKERTRASVVGRYSDSWTPEDGGRWRSGIENAVRALKAAGYSRVGPRRWEQEDSPRLPAALTVAILSVQWPHTCEVKHAS